MWRRLYSDRLLDNLKFEVIEGDFQVAEGIDIIYSPGHTPGGQSVSVRTDEGIAIIVGFCSTYQNFNPSTRPSGQTIPVTIPDLNTNILEAYDSLVKIKEMADIILPLHDSAVLLKEVVP
jgi:glyoxylase-like metal-dependent hydrolase (beta-lactamase superfamily II)